MKKDDRARRAWLIRLYILFLVSALFIYILLYGSILRLEDRVTKLEQQNTSISSYAKIVNTPQPEEPTQTVDCNSIAGCTNCPKGYTCKINNFGEIIISKIISKCESETERIQQLSPEETCKEAAKLNNLTVAKYIPNFQKYGPVCFFDNNGIILSDGNYVSDIRSWLTKEACA